MSLRAHIKIMLIIATVSLGISMIVFANLESPKVIEQPEQPSHWQICPDGEEYECPTSHPETPEFDKR